MGCHRCYDHRIKAMIINAKDPNLFPDLNIPLTTAKTWIRKGVRDVVTIDELDIDREKLLKENVGLKRQVTSGQVKNELVVFTFRLFGLSIQYQRLPSAEAKTTILERIKQAAMVSPLKDCLEAIGLSIARFHNWTKRQVRCSLTDQPSCPRLSPTQLTHSETDAIKNFVTSKEHVHFSIPSLAWFVKRQCIVFASLSS